MTCEMIGTMLFVYAIMTNGGDNAGVALALFASVIIFGGITGGHFNPAVTLAVFIRRGHYGQDFIFMILTIVAQIIGGLLAIGLAYVSLYDSSTGKPYNGWVAQLCPKTNFSADAKCDGSLGHFHLTFNVIINEIICTFIFISVILTVTNAKIFK